MNKKFNEKLINHLIKNGYIKSQKVKETLLSIDRAEFTDLSPYQDSPQQIGFNVTISAPHMHAFALEYLSENLKPGKKALDIGCGSGILCIAFLKMMDFNGQVFGIDHIPQLVDKSIKNLSKSYKKELEDKKIVVVEGDGRKGLKEYAPYDCIHIGAAINELNDTILDQLAPGGILLAPVENKGLGYQSVQIVRKNKEGKINTEKVLDVRYVPLTSKEEQLKNY